MNLFPARCLSTLSSFPSALFLSVAALPGSAGAQVLQFDTFEYPDLADLNGLSGGTHWNGPWIVAAGNWTVQDSPFLGDGGHVRCSAISNLEIALRAIDTTVHAGLAAPNGEYGSDGSTIYVQFAMRRPVGGDADVCGMVLFSANGDSLQVVKAPGADTVGLFGTNLPFQPIPGTDVDDGSTFTMAITFQPGPELVRVWEGNDITLSADLTATTGVDFTFRELAFYMQAVDFTGNAVEFDQPALFLVEVGGPGCLGVNTCPANPNSTGGPATLCATGSQDLVDNDLTITASSLPDQPGTFFYGMLYGPGTPFGDGILCVSSPFVRLTPIFATGGMAAQAIDLSSFVPGQGYYFQFWYRDPAGGGAGFNLSNLLEIAFD